MKNKAVVIGGSAGSFKIVSQIIGSLPKKINVPIFICMHRLRNVNNGFTDAFKLKSKINIIEPLDNETINNNNIYIAPANYHMYISENGIKLSVEEEINHSRPSIDLTFMSAAECYSTELLGIILSGANNDGSAGISKIKQMGGTTIAQNPDNCDINVMPLEAIKTNCVDKILTINEIIKYLLFFVSV